VGIVLMDEFPKTEIGRVHKDVLEDRVIAASEPSEQGANHDHID
jgi:hypothetical protein